MRYLMLLGVAILAIAGCTPSPTPTPSPVEASVVILQNDAGEPSLPPSYERPVDPRSEAEKAATACTGSHGEWLCKSYKKPATFAASAAPVTPISWTITDWYVNPNNDASGGGDTCASDGNSCTAATCTGGCSGSSCPSGIGACRTFGEVIQHRLGTFTPRLQQITVFHKLSAQALGQDLIFFQPFLGAGGQAKLIDSLVPWDGGSTATISAFLPKQPDAGQLLQISGLPTGATAGLFVCDVTQGFSCAFIDSMVDAGTAKMEQPLTDASFNFPTNTTPAGVEVNSWTTGDSLNIYTENATNLKAWNPVAGDVSDAGTFSGGWVQFTNVVDLGSGTPPSALPVIAQGELGYAGCKIDPRVHVSTLGGRGNPPYMFGNYETGTYIQIAGGIGLVEGGGYLNGLEAFNGAHLAVGQDAIVHGGLVSAGGITIQGSTGGVYVDATGTFVGNANFGGTLTSSAGVSSGSFLWGPGGVTVAPLSQVSFSFWVNYMVGGTSSFTNGSTTGARFVPATGTYTAPITISQSTLLDAGSLGDPNLGSTFTNGTP